MVEATIRTKGKLTLGSFDVTPHSSEKVAAGSTLTRSKATERLNLRGLLPNTTFENKRKN